MSDIEDNERISKYYESHYSSVHYRGILGFFTKGYHRRLERNLGPDSRFSNVLEIGGGTGEHLEFVKHDFDEYLLLDISESPDALKRLKLDPRASRIKFVLADATKIPLEDSKYERFWLLASFTTFQI